VLLALALEFEKQSEVSFAISANVLRLFEQESILVRALPRLSGVSKEAIATSISFLEKRGFAQVESSGRTKALALKPKGYRVQDRYRELTAATRFENVREALHDLTGESLLMGLEPYPDGWRASIPRPTALPHYPTILHRGGFPDGS
jgi:predicted transcriptional regulator